MTPKMNPQEAVMREKIELGFTVDIAIEDLAEELADCDRTKLLKLIESIDRQMADWDFTMALYAYFSDMKKEYDAENEVIGF